MTLSDLAGRPWFHCLEDYVLYTKHRLVIDGWENTSAPLAAVTTFLA